MAARIHRPGRELDLRHLRCAARQRRAVWVVNIEYEPERGHDVVGRVVRDVAARVLEVDGDVTGRRPELLERRQVHPRARRWRSGRTGSRSGSQLVRSRRELTSDRAAATTPDGAPRSRLCRRPGTRKATRWSARPRVHGTGVTSRARSGPGPRCPSTGSSVTAGHRRRSGRTSTRGRSRPHQGRSPCSKAATVGQASRRTSMADPCLSARADDTVGRRRGVRRLGRGARRRRAARSGWVCSRQ